MSARRWPAPYRRSAGTTAALSLAGLAAPYDRLNGRGPDGLALYRARDELALPAELFTAQGVPATDEEGHAGTRRLCATERRSPPAR